MSLKNNTKMSEQQLSKDTKLVVSLNPTPQHKAKPPVDTQECREIENVYLIEISPELAQGLQST